jgi:hypothetical protein
MDSEIIYALGGITIFILIIQLTLAKSNVKIIQTKDEKRDEILSAYKEDLRNTLKDFANDNKMKIVKKSFLLKKYSDELSRNIFFDKDEIREIILELSKED